MKSSHREFFATLGIIISWLIPLVAFFLLLNLPPVRDLVTGFAFIAAIYSTFQFFRWGNQPSTVKDPIIKPTDGRTRNQLFLDSLTVSELEDLQRQIQARLIAHAKDQEELES